ncbi:hypothetical protein [Agrococcus sp. SGAir0287]|uniref:hypothetical protein n=1 Tax=Agrococcus sp. SGAir0287 TaxID=2070347 RepID=UPI0010CCB97C|nr:hypothetical protein [Agrococcus sp. SGAir0287]QCR18082.1 hypothetical protein C1N71_00325 [Agrococcus sp. SGAir0287]
MRTSRPIAVYLRDHETGAEAGLRAFRRAAGSHRSRPWGSDLAHLAGQVRDDLRTEQRMLRFRSVRRRRLGAVVVALGERAGRLKGNGRVLRRSPTTDVIELEGLLALVQAKRAHWRTLELAGLLEGSGIDVGALVSRADAQLRRLDAAHDQAAAALRARAR